MGADPEEALGADKFMYLKLLKFLYREATGPWLRITAVSLVVGLCSGALVAIFNAAAAEQRTSVRLWLLVAFVAGLVVYLVGSYDASVQSDRMITGMVRRLRLRLCEKLLYAKLSFLESQGVGEIYTQIGHHIGGMQSAASTILGAAQAAIVVLFVLGYLAWLSLFGLLFGIAAIIVGAAIYYYYERKVARLADAMYGKETAFYNALNDLLHGFKELKLRRARHTDLSQDMAQITAEYRELTLEMSRISVKSGLTSHTFTYIVIGVLVFVLPSVFTIGTSTIFQFLATILFGIGYIERLVSAYPGISRGCIALREIERLETALDSGMEENREPAVTPLPFEGITFDKVCYQFDSQNTGERFEVGPLDFELRPGEIVFVIGGNGAGKTTLIKLLTGLYRPLSGAISTPNGIVPTADTQAYREMFAVVFSDFHLFRRLYGIKGDDALAPLNDLLLDLDIAHKTRIEDGTFTTINLSAGQRKRLSYAVERLYDRQVYVFDEFASDQDPTFRRYFYRQLLPDLKRRGKTVVAVTHDDRWFDVADRVVKMEYGQIVEVADGAAMEAIAATHSQPTRNPHRPLRA
jgi:putative ATP-binding cassette transporter